MLQTLTFQNGVRPAVDARTRELDPCVLSLITRDTPTIRDTAPLSEAVEQLLTHSPWGVPVTGANGSFRGMCTFRSVASLCLLLKGETSALMPSLGFLRDDFVRIGERLKVSLTMPAVDAVDPYAPAIEATANLPEVFFHFYRGHQALPVTEGEERRFIGVISCDRALRAVLDRPAPAR